MFEIIFHNRAQKAYDKLDDKTASRINKAIEGLKVNPFLGKDIKKLRGKLEGRYRLRVGALRVVYKVEVDESLIIIEAIGGRGDIYS